MGEHYDSDYLDENFILAINVILRMSSHHMYYAIVVPHSINYHFNSLVHRIDYSEKNG